MRFHLAPLLALLALATTFTACGAAGDAPRASKVITTQNAATADFSKSMSASDPVTGKSMFTSFCAACHGHQADLATTAGLSRGVLIGASVDAMVVRCPHLPTLLSRADLDLISAALQPPAKAAKVKMKVVKLTPAEAKEFQK